MADELPMVLPAQLGTSDYIIPVITSNPGIIKAAKAAIEVLLKFKGIDVTLKPNKSVATAKPSGGHDFTSAGYRATQRIALSKVGNDIITESTYDQGAARMRNYVLTGRWDMAIAVGDTFNDDRVDYVVETVDDSSGFKTSAEVLGYIKV